MATNSNLTKTVLFSVGIAAGLASLATGVGGGALVWAHATQRDDAGFYTTSTEEFATSSQAMVAGDVDLGADPAGRDRLPDVLQDVDLRVTATGTGGKPIFVGIARRADVDAYLAGSTYDRIDDVNFSPFRVDYRRVDGQARLAPPAAQPFWVAFASGSGPQAAAWGVEDGQWAVVVMNADASDGVTVDLSVGARSGLLVWVGVGLLVFAASASVGSTMAFREAARGSVAPLRPPSASRELEGVR